MSPERWRASFSAWLTPVIEAVGGRANFTGKALLRHGETRNGPAGTAP
jgi:hypothetical protein